MRNLMIVLVLAGLVGRARADEVSGFVVDHDRVVPHAVVRIVGERVVVFVRADAHGHFDLRGWPGGPYRIEVEHGVVADYAPYHDPPKMLTLDPRLGIICVLPMGRTFEGVLGAAAGTTPEPPRMPNGKPRGFVDTTSTALETHLVFFGH